MLLVSLFATNAKAQSLYWEKQKVKEFTKGLPDDLDKNVIVFDKKKYISQVFNHDILHPEDIDKHWKKCLKALEDYPFTYIILDEKDQDPLANDAKYIFRFYPDVISKYEVSNDRILTLQEKTTLKHYGLKEQRDHGNSKADYSYLEMRYFVKEVKKIYNK